jgi:hypothetical protein
MSDWTNVTWDEAFQRGYEALTAAEAIYQDIDSRVGRSNVDIEKHLRRAEIKIAQSQAWIVMARALDERHERERAG